MKEKLNNRRIFMIVGVLLLGAVIYLGYTRYLNLRYMESELNNRYENAFQNINNHLDSLEQEMGMVLLSTTDDNLSTNLSRTWRSAYSAHESIGEIPISSNTLSNTKRLLDKIIWYSRHLDDDIASKDGLNDDEIKIIQELKQKIVTINKDLVEIDNKMERENFTWHNKKRVNLDLEEEDYDGSSLLAISELDSNLNLSGIKENFANIDINIAEIRADEVSAWQNFEFATGDSINEQEVLEIAEEFVNKHNQGDYRFEIIEAGKSIVEGKEVDNEMPAYAIEATNLDDRSKNIYLDLSQEDGTIISYLKQRAIGDKSIELEEGIENAEEILKDATYKDLKVVDQQEYNDILLVSLIQEVDEIMIKSNVVKAEVALDNGEVLAFDGSDYFLNQVDGEIDLTEFEPSISEQEAEEKVSDLLDIKRMQKVIIKDRTRNQMLCYEFMGYLANDEENKYLVLINADDGREERINAKKRHGI